LKSLYVYTRFINKDKPTIGKISEEKTRDFVTEKTQRKIANIAKSLM